MMPFWGLGEVTGLTQETVLGAPFEFYHIRPLRLDHPIKFPERDLAEMGFRPVLSGREMREIVFGRPPASISCEGAQVGGYHRWVKLLRSGRPGVRRVILCEIQQAVASGRILHTRESELRAVVTQNFREEIQLVFGCSRQKAAAYARNALA